jgi:WD40 repeat protein
MTMSRLNLSPLASTPPTVVVLGLPVPEGAASDLAVQAEAAARGEAPAPVVTWKASDLTDAVPVSLLGRSFDAPAASITPPRICVVGLGDTGSADDLGLGVASGAVVVDATALDASPGLADALWPQSMAERLGALRRLRVGPAGLDIEVEAASDLRRFRLVPGSTLDLSPGESEALLTWRQVSWLDAHLDPGTHKNPAARLADLRTATRARLDRPAAQPLTVVNRFDPLGQIDSAVFVRVRRRGNASEAREYAVPAWSILVGQAEWAPRIVALIGDGADLAGLTLLYSDGTDPFATPENAPPDRLTTAEWTWTATAPASSDPVLPRLRKLPTSLPSPPLLSTGEISGAGANSPYLWQAARLEIGDQSETGVWLRYRLDALAERPSAASRDADFAAGLSRPVRLEPLRRDHGGPDPWTLDLGLLPDGEVPPGGPRVWLDLALDASGSRTATLTINSARVEAQSPRLRALRIPLSDPSALPNRADQFEGLHPETRVRLANDRVPPGSGFIREHAVEAKLDETTGALLIASWEGAHDVAVAYVGGPMAGLEEVSLARGNLAPRNAPDFGADPDKPPPEQVRQYGPGRVPVHLLQRIDLRDEPGYAGSGSVRVAAAADTFLPQAEAVAALLPWSLWRVTQLARDVHALEPYHRNLVSESFEWAASAPDRHDPEPTDPPPSIDPRDYPEHRPRDFRHEEALASLDRAVRDRFARSSAGLLSGPDGSSDLANWLPGVTFSSARGTALSPKIERTEGSQVPSEAPLPALTFRWAGATTADRLPPQTLALVESPPLGGEVPPVDWLDARLRWTGGRPEQPALEVHVDGRAGARLAAGADVPLLEHREVVSAVAAGWLSGRYWQFYAVDSPAGPRLFAREPLAAGSSPQPLDTALSLDTAPINLLALDAGDDTLILAVVQGDSATVAAFRSAEGEIGLPDSTKKVAPLGSPVSAARVAARQLFLGLGAAEGANSFLVFNLNTSGNSAPDSVFETDAGPVQALDVRGLPGGSALVAAVSSLSSDGTVRASLYYWDHLTNFGQPTHSPDNADASKRTPRLEAEMHQGARITSLVVQPLPHPSEISSLGFIAGVFVYVSVVNQDQGGQVLTWPFARIPLDDTLSPPAPDGPAEDRGLRGLTTPVTALLSDPALDDDDELHDGSPQATLLVAVTESTNLGQTEILAWPVLDWFGGVALTQENLSTVRPSLGTPSTWDGHEGRVRSLAVVPGRSLEPSPPRRNPKNARFGARVVTGGTDGTIRTWDPDTGVELDRQVATTSQAWLDTLGTVRTPRVPAPAGPGFWVEPAVVADPSDPGSRTLILSLSTLGGPIDLFDGSNLAETNSALRFLCLDLPLEKDRTDGFWKPLPWEDSARSHVLRHGVCGCLGQDAEVPRLAGVPAEVVRLLAVTLDETFDPPPMQGQVVVPRELRFEAVLANPADTIPDGRSVPIVSQGASTIVMKLTRTGDAAAFSVELEPSSTFDWRFPLTRQVPDEEVSVLPGRLDRLTGSVTLDEGRLRLKPSNNSKAEALGRPRDLVDLPELTADPDPEKPDRVRFRESLTDGKLEPLGNRLPRPQDGPVVAVDTALGPEGAPAALIATQPAEPNASGLALLADLASGSELVRFGAGFRRARLVLESGADAHSRRLTGIGVGEDGSVRVQRLWELTQVPDSGAIRAAEVDRERTRYALPSPVEDVHVFDTPDGARRWLLARGRDGSAWLWDATSDTRRFDLTPPDTAATTVAFGPPIPADVADERKSDFQPWRVYFGGFDPGLVEGFDTVAAVGGADGSVRLYAVSNLVTAAGPPLVRTLFLRGEPVTSISLLVDQHSKEAQALGRAADQALPGLVVLACDDAGPPTLTEVLSGLSLINNPDAAPLQESHRAALGQLFNEESLIVVLKSRTDSNSALVSLAKDISTGQTRFPVVNSLMDDASQVIDLARGGGPQPVVAAVLGDGGWRLYTLSANRFEFRKSDARPILDASLVTVGEDFKQRYMLTTRPNGAVRTWVQPDLDVPAGWNPVTPPDNQPPVSDRPVRISAAVAGRVVVPLVASRGPEDQLGRTWAADLGAAVSTWPEALGAVQDDTPVTLAGWNGAAHLVVGRPSDLTVWNLDSGRLVARLGLDLAPVAVDAAADLDRLWLLVASQPESGHMIWRLSDASASSLPDPSNFVQGGTLATADARLFALPRGVVLVTASVSAGETATLTVSVRTTALDPIATSTATLNSAPTSTLRLIELATFEGTLWLLLLIDGHPFVIELSIDNRLYSISAEAPIAAAFDLDPNPDGSQRPVVWTVDANWSRVTASNLPAPDANNPPVSVVDVTRSFSANSGLPAGLEVATDPHLAVVRGDGATLLVAASREAVAVWDLPGKILVRTDQVERAEPAVVRVAVSAAILSDAARGDIRFWDLATGHLRQRLSAVETGLARPAALAAVNAPARPRLVVSGADDQAGIVVLDLQSGRVLVSPHDVNIAPGSLAASLRDPASLVVAGIVTEGQDRVAKAWSAALGAEADLFTSSGASPVTLRHPKTGTSLVGVLALHRQGTKTYLATADERTLLVRDLSDTQSVLATGSTEPFPVVAENEPRTVAALRVSTSVDDDCVLAAVSLAPSQGGSGARLALFDLPLGPPVGPRRPVTSWSLTTDQPPGSITVLSDDDGPKLVADMVALRAGTLLRVVEGLPPRYNLRVQLLGSSDAFLLGRITPSRRLDLQVRLKPSALGLPRDLGSLSARAALVQGSYSCFQIQPVIRDDVRLSGVLVLWNDSAVSSDRIFGVVLLDDTQPEAPAKVEIPSLTNGGSTVLEGVKGPRVRLRAIPFDPDSAALDSLSWSEVLTWQAATGTGSRAFEFHLSESVVSVPMTGSPAEYHLARSYLKGTSGPSVQGDLVVEIERTTSHAESYTLRLLRSAYVASPVVIPRTSETETLDDVVYPTDVLQGPLGRAFDLVEPSTVGGGSQEGPVHLVSPALDGNRPRLLKVAADDLPFDPGSGPGATRPLPKAPIQVPQLVHREAHGGRIRGVWPDGSQPLTPVDGTDTLEDGGTSDWLLAPLARTPRGVSALTPGVLVRPGGRLLEWTRLQTEGVLAVHRDGGALFASPPADGGAGENGRPSVVNLFSATLRRSSAGAARNELVLSDDARVRALVLRTGTTGVIVARTADARGRVAYRFVNSPYYSLIPPVAKRPPEENLGRLSLSLAEPVSLVGVESSVPADPRVLPPQALAGRSLLGSPRFQPAAPGSDRPDARGFERFGRLDPDRDRTAALRLSETPALRAAEIPDSPLPAAAPLAEGLKAFLPTRFELGFGMGKPGALFHQAVQCVAAGTEESTLLASLPTSLARREPQRLTPPNRAAIAFNQVNLSRDRRRGVVSVSIEWVELVGAVDVSPSDFEAVIRIHSDGQETPTLTLEDAEGVLVPVSRLGESVVALPRERSPDLPTPLSRARDGRSVASFDLVFATRADLETPPVSDDGSAIPNLAPMLLAVTLDGAPQPVAALPPRPLHDLMLLTEQTDDGWRLWQLVRDEGQPPEFLRWLAQAGDAANLSVNLVWLPETGLDQNDLAGSYARAPKLYPDGAIRVRDVQFEPQAPRLSSVIRLPATDPSLLSTIREITLFDGPAASAAGIRPTILTEHGQTRIRFEARDAETVGLADPFPASLATVSIGSFGLYLAKNYDDGATLVVCQAGNVFET